MKNIRCWSSHRVFFCGVCRVNMVNSIMRSLLVETNEPTEALPLPERHHGVVSGRRVFDVLIYDELIHEHFAREKWLLLFARRLCKYNSQKSQRYLLCRSDSSHSCTMFHISYLSWSWKRVRSQQADPVILQNRWPLGFLFGAMALRHASVRVDLPCGFEQWISSWGRFYCWSDGILLIFPNHQWISWGFCMILPKRIQENHRNLMRSCQHGELLSTLWG